MYRAALVHIDDRLMPARFPLGAILQLSPVDGRLGAGDDGAPNLAENEGGRDGRMAGWILQPSKSPMNDDDAAVGNN